MMTTQERIALLEGQRDRLRRAMRSGARLVRHGEKIIEYRTMAEMQTALDDIDSEIGQLENPRPRSRIRYFTNSKGLG